MGRGPVGIRSAPAGKATPDLRQNGHYADFGELPAGRDWGKAARAQIRAGKDMLLVTGGAGFIGSNLVAALNDAGRSDVAVCDLLVHDGKSRHLAKRQLVHNLPPGEPPEFEQGPTHVVIIHPGTIAPTPATAAD